MGAEIHKAIALQIKGSGFDGLLLASY